MKPRTVALVTHAIQPATPRTAIILAVAAMLLSLVLLTWNCYQRDLLFAPPVNGGDEDSYERLGYNIAAGLGYGYCPADQPILEGKTDPQAVDRCVAGCAVEEFQLTAYRPPAFPMLIAAVYKLSPLNFFLVRFINLAFSAGAIGVAAFHFARHGSVAVAIVLSILCAADPRYREFAGTFLTENMATWCFCLFFLSLDMLFRQPTTIRAVFCGLTLSGLVATRSFYVAWYPFLWILVAWSLYFRRDSSPWMGHVRRPSAIFAIFAVTSLAITGPWWIRNCIVLNAIMPTGTQGGIGLADGFSESAWKNHGSWTAETANLIRDEMRQDPYVAMLSGLEFEKEHSRRCSEAARQWIRSNRHRLLQLTLWKLSRLWEYGSVLHSGLFGLMFVGLFVSRQTAMSRIMILLLILNSLTVMATYHTYERFFTPFRPLIYGFVSLALITLPGKAIRSCCEPEFDLRKESLPRS